MTNFEYWLRYKAEEHIPAAILVLGLLFIIFGLYPLMKYCNTYECEQYEAVTGRETKMVDMNCYIKYDGEWYRANEFKVIVK
jgi:hypothetical protein